MDTLLLGIVHAVPNRVRRINRSRMITKCVEATSPQLTVLYIRLHELSLDVGVWCKERMLESNSVYLIPQQTINRQCGSPWKKS